MDSCIPRVKVGRRHVVGVDWDGEALFERCVRREAPFAGLYVLANAERTRWALPYLIARLRAGGPLSTRLEFTEARA